MFSGLGLMHLDSWWRFEGYMCSFARMQERQCEVHPLGDRRRWLGPCCCHATQCCFQHANCTLPEPVCQRTLPTAWVKKVARWFYSMWQQCLTCIHHCKNWRCTLNVLVCDGAFNWCWGLWFMGSGLTLLPGAIIRDTLRCGCCCAVDELPIRCPWWCPCCGVCCRYAADGVVCVGGRGYLRLRMGGCVREAEEICGLPMFSGFTLPGTLFALGVLLGGGRRCER